MKAILQNNTILRIKRILKKIIVFNIQDYYVSLIRKKTKTIRHGNLTYKFSTPSKLCKMRADTFSTKEPETLDWIDSFAEGSILQSAMPAQEQNMQRKETCQKMVTQLQCRSVVDKI